MLIGRTEAEAEAPIQWPSDEKNWLIGKDPDTGENRRQKKKGTTEDEMIGWQHWLSGLESEQPPGDGDGQGSLVSCSLCNHKESDMTEWLNNKPSCKECNHDLPTFKNVSIYFQIVLK